jgi:hypothetical protein
MRTLVLFSFAVCAAAQGLTEPPPIIQLVRKPGTAGASLKPYADAGAAVHVIGMRAITGLPETWMLEAHYSFASVEELDQRLAAVSPVQVWNESGPLHDDVLAPARTMMATHVPAWSYRGDEAIRNFGKARYFQISVFRIRPGTEGNFGQLVRLRRANADVINLDRPELAYRVISGAPAGTLIFVAPIVSLRTLDEGVAPVPPVAEGLAAAKSSDGAKIAAETEISREHLLFRVEPRISHVSDEFASADTAFWRGKK